MSQLRKRVCTGVMGIVIALTFAACDADEDPATTTAPVDASTSEPVGS